MVIGLIPSRSRERRRQMRRLFVLTRNSPLLPPPLGRDL